MRESWSLLLNPSFLAKATGTKVVTVRYCEQAGLLPAPPRQLSHLRGGSPAPAALHSPVPGFGVHTQYLGELDYAINDRSQIAPVEAWAIVHLPWLFSGGIDVKAGQYVTLEGAEVIDPTGDYLYSHSYIFNFGIPFKHTGIMTISHVDPLLDVYAGVDTGVNTTFGNGQGDNNGAAAFHGGIGLNLLDGNLTIMATTHIGPENPDTNGTNNTINNTINIPALNIIPFCGCNPNNTLRYLNDITATWKVTDSFTLITDANYIHDDGTFLNANGFEPSIRAAMASPNTPSTRLTIGCRLSDAPRFGGTTTISSSRLFPGILISSTPSTALLTHPLPGDPLAQERPIWS